MVLALIFQSALAAHIRKGDEGVWGVWVWGVCQLPSRKAGSCLRIDRNQIVFVNSHTVVACARGHPLRRRGHSRRRYGRRRRRRRRHNRGPLVKLADSPLWNNCFPFRCQYC